MKRFLTKTLIMVVPIIGMVLYYVMAVEPHKNGDLGNLGFIPFDESYNTTINSMGLDSVYAISIDNLDSIDCDSSILTIGDSFSILGTSSYQNFLAKLYPGFKIYNLDYNHASEASDEPAVNYQLFVDKLIQDAPLPRIIILESVERYIADRLYNLKFYPHAETDRITEMSAINRESLPEENNQIKSREANSLLTRIIDNKEKLRKNFLNTQEYIKKRFNIDNPVKHLKLRQEMFTCEGREDDLFFYRDDLIDIPENIYTESRHKLDSLFSITEQKGIRFVFLVPSDKYDLYKDFTINDTYGAKGQLAAFDQYNDNPRFLNGKELLYPYLKQGEKDIYRCNDTHWSPLASSYVAKELKRRLDIQEKQ